MTGLLVTPSRPSALVRLSASESAVETPDAKDVTVPMSSVSRDEARAPEASLVNVSSVGRTLAAGKSEVKMARSVVAPAPSTIDVAASGSAVTASSSEVKLSTTDKTDERIEVADSSVSEIISSASELAAVPTSIALGKSVAKLSTADRADEMAEAAGTLEPKFDRPSGEGISLAIDGKAEARLSAEVTADTDDNASSRLESSDARLSSAGRADVRSSRDRSVAPVIAGLTVFPGGDSSDVRLPTISVVESSTTDVGSAVGRLCNGCGSMVDPSIGGLGWLPGSAVFVEATGIVVVLKKVEVDREVDVLVVGTMTVVSLPLTLVLLGRQKIFRSGILMVNTFAIVMVWNRRSLVLTRRYVFISKW